LSDPSTDRTRNLLLWTLLIVAVTLPWYGFQLTPRWSAIRVLPPHILGRRKAILDIVLNVALYVPFGYWMIRPGKTSAARIGKVIVIAFLLSLFAETSQVFSRNRFPSATDLVTNTIGAGIGALLARWRNRDLVLQSALGRAISFFVYGVSFLITSTLPFV
jgi:glycopeptide antibiotics resistance protein